MYAGNWKRPNKTCIPEAGGLLKGVRKCPNILPKGPGKHLRESEQAAAYSGLDVPRREAQAVERECSRKHEQTTTHSRPTGTGICPLTAREWLCRAGHMQLRIQQISTHNKQEATQAMARASDEKERGGAPLPIQPLRRTRPRTVAAPLAAPEQWTGGKGWREAKGGEKA